VARQTRAQRRERRAQLAANGTAPAAAEGARSRPAPARDEDVREAGGHLPGAGGRRFVSESVAELKKVEWPTQSQLVAGTTVVLIACVIVGVYLYAADRVFSPLVNWLIGH
jgi:preprotein translocase subunit SecE